MTRLLKISETAYFYGHTGLPEELCLFIIRPTANHRLFTNSLLTLY